MLSEANALNVPKDVIQRNIKKAMDPVTADYKELTYEAYGELKEPQSSFDLATRHLDAYILSNLQVLEVLV